MNKLEYKKLCKKQPTKWLEYSADHPGPYQSKLHIAIIKIVLRHRRCAIQYHLLSAKP